MKVTKKYIEKLIKEELEGMKIDEQQTPQDAEMFKNLRNLVLQVIASNQNVPPVARASLAGEIALEVALYLEKGSGVVIDTVKPHKMNEEEEKAMERAKLKRR